jgi:hypothetical protein
LLPFRRVRTERSHRLSCRISRDSIDQPSSRRSTGKWRPRRDYLYTVRLKVAAVWTSDHHPPRLPPAFIHVPTNDAPSSIHPITSPRTSGSVCRKGPVAGRCGRLHGCVRGRQSFRQAAGGREEEGEKAKAAKGENAGKNALWTASRTREVEQVGNLIDL